MYSSGGKSVWQNMEIDEIFSDRNAERITDEKSGLEVELGEKRQHNVLSLGTESAKAEDAGKKMKTVDFVPNDQTPLLQLNHQVHSMQKDAAKISSVENHCMNRTNESTTHPIALRNDKLKPYPSEIKVVLEEDRRLSDVSRESRFDKLVNACESLAPDFDHTAVSNIAAERNMNNHRDSNQNLRSETAVEFISETSKLVNLPTSVEAAVDMKQMAKVKVDEKATSSQQPEKWGESLSISVAPKDPSILSDYNYTLTKNVEFFEIKTSYSVADTAVGISIEGLPTSKVGLRCIHCGDNSRHTTASSFFPSSIGSIASGLGTIGSRHFAQGKCPLVDEDTLQILRSTKKSSQQQTRLQGKVGLDAYCKGLAKRSNVATHEAGGIYVLEVPRAMKENDASCKIADVKDVKVDKSSMSLGKKAADCDSTNVEMKKNDPSTFNVQIKKNDPSAFVAGAIEHFWECKHCNSLPFAWRASGSVVFSVNAPKLEQVSRHLSICQGKKPLRIPRDATMQTVRNDNNGVSVQVRWKKPTSLGKRSTRSEQVRSSTKGKKVENKHVKKGVDDSPLAFDDDKALTTQFAHFTVLQLKKCYLTKNGGSRANCPIGYPGLACSYCAGTSSERRFFYTSADHLRNSFSHIPAHLVTCKHCPADVKQQIEEFKALRSKQKSLLSNGSHKVFIDRVWERLHGPGGGMIDTAKEECNQDGDVSDDESYMSSVSVDMKCNEKEYNYHSLDGRWIENSDFGIDSSATELVSVNDRRLTTDYVFFAMLQMVPMIPKEASNSDVQTLEGVKNEKLLESSGTKDEESQLVQLKDTHLQQNSDGAQAVIPPKEVEKGVEEELPSTTRTITDTRKVDEQHGTGMYDMERAKVNEVQLESESKVALVKECQLGIKCKHCGDDSVCFSLVPGSAEGLRNQFSDATNHLLSCAKCPEDVKAKLNRFKALRATQEALLKYGMHRKFMQLVWSRLTLLARNGSSSSNEASPTNASRSLLSEEDRELVTEYTYYTMEQMKPCTLQRTGNGARSMFSYGFPGLACMHCEGTPSARTFFYRTKEILAGNYAHIPNHILTCKSCPPHVKQILAEKKKDHSQQKLRLNRGSQRLFFNNLWARLHLARS